MGFGNGMSIGWPNATSGRSIPVPTTESYYLWSCSGEENLISEPYAIGTFQNGYRVLIDGGNYGYIDNTVPPENGGTNIENLPIGYVDYRCNDSDINLGMRLEQQETGIYNIILDGVETLGNVDVSSSSNTWSVPVNYDIYWDSDDGYPSIHLVGTKLIEVTSYNITAGTGTELASEFLYNTGSAGNYYVADARLWINNLTIENIVLGPYDTGWDLPNKYVTDYGNVWTFYYTSSR